jgi:ribonuclease Z
MSNHALAVGGLVGLMLLGLAITPAAVLSGSQPPAMPTGASAHPAPSDGMRVILLGTGVGPPVNLNQYGASTLIEAGGMRLLFDCGRGATIRLTQAGIPLASVTRLFLTHLHSDHVVQIPDLLLAGWVVGPGRKTPLDVWGPTGTGAMMAGLEKAFAFDIHLRRDIDEKFPAEGIAVRSHDIEAGVVFDEGGLKVTAIVVDHEPVAPAFGYRVDFRGRSVVLSGDTRPSENLIRAATGADVLIHEAVDPVALRATLRGAALTELIIAHHTSGEQAGQLFARVKPRLAVFSHAPSSDVLLAQARQHYSGRLEGAEDLLVIDVADAVSVRRIPH